MTNLIPSPDRSLFARSLSVVVVLCSTFMIPMTGNSQTTGARSSIESSKSSGGNGRAEHSLGRNKNEFSLWVAGSFGLPAALGGSRDRKIPLLVGLRYGRVLAASKYAGLEYTFDLVPAALVSGPKGGFSNPGGLASPGGGRNYVYGAGFIPVGFKLFVAPEHRIKPYLTVSSGPIYFTKQVPVPDSANFNFISTAGGGVQIFLSSRRAINVEYRVGHLSNAGVGNLNPGFNSSTIHAGFSVFR